MVPPRTKVNSIIILIKKILDEWAWLIHYVKKLSWFYSDLLTEEDWIVSNILSIYITPKPDVEMDAVSSISKKVVLGSNAIYTLSVRNTGSGEDDFIVTTEYNSEWDILIDFTDFNLDAGESKTIRVTISPQDSVSDGQKLSVTVTVTAASDSSVKDSKILIGAVSTLIVTSFGKKSVVG